MKKFSKIPKSDWFVYLFLAVLVLPRFFGLDSGLVLGEPDEFIHADVARNFAKSWWPVFSGGGWYFELPFYPFLGYLVSLIFPGRYLGLRLVSAFASLLLTFGFYAYFKYKFSKRLGFVIAFLWVISPLSIYYSRLALLDSWTIAFGMLSLFIFDVALGTRKKSWAVFAGFLLGLAMLVKYTALIYLMVPMIYFVVFSLEETIGLERQKTGGKGTLGRLRPIWGNISHLETVNLNITSFLTLATIFLMTFPLMVILRQHEPYQFKLQTLTTLGFVRDFWRITGGELTLGDYLRDVPWWLTWPVIVLAVIGVAAQIRSSKSPPPLSKLHIGLFSRVPFGMPRRAGKVRNLKLPMVLWLGLFFTCLIVIPHTPFYPRYFLPLVPFIIIFAGIGFELILRITDYRLPIVILLCALLIVFVLPTSLEAYRATTHNLIEDTGQYIKSQSQTEDSWLFSNYWPHFFGRAAETSRATWLADSAWEARAFVSDVEKSPLEILEEDGGFVALEELYSYSPMFISPPSRTNAWEYIKENCEPTTIIEDDFPNFPHFRDSKDRVLIFEF